MFFYCCCATINMVNKDLHNSMIDNTSDEQIAAEVADKLTNSSDI